MGAWWPYLLARGAYATSYQAYCWVGEEGIYQRIGIYAMDEINMTPTDLIIDLGTLSGDTSGRKTLTFDAISLPLGFFLCVWQSAMDTGRWSYRAGVGPAPALWPCLASDGVDAFAKMRTEDYGAGLPQQAPAAVQLAYARPTNANCMAAAGRLFIGGLT